MRARLREHRVRRAPAQSVTHSSANMPSAPARIAEDDASPTIDIQRVDDGAHRREAVERGSSPTRRAMRSTRDVERHAAAAAHASK